jgi:hypothetical protein
MDGFQGDLFGEWVEAHFCVCVYKQGGIGASSFFIPSHDDEAVVVVAFEGDGTNGSAYFIIPVGDDVFGYLAELIHGGAIPVIGVEGIVFECAPGFVSSPSFASCFTVYTYHSSSLSDVGMFRCSFIHHYLLVPEVVQYLLPWLTPHVDDVV